MASPSDSTARRRRDAALGRTTRTGYTLFGRDIFKSNSQDTCAMPAPMRPAPSTATDDGFVVGVGFFFAAVMPSNSPISADDSLVFASLTKASASNAKASEGGFPRPFSTQFKIS